MREIYRQPVFSRNGVTHPLGKMSDKPIRIVRLPMVAQERLEQQARAIRIPFHEYIREALSIVAMQGADAVKDMYAARIDAIAKAGQEPNSKE